MTEKLIRIIGGSGLYQVEGIEGLREEEVKTPFGEPSDRYLVGRLEGRPVASLPHHGKVIAGYPRRSISGRTSVASRSWEWNGSFR